jgi:hypothetical protein
MERDLQRHRTDPLRAHNCVGKRRAAIASSIIVAGVALGACTAAPLIPYSADTPPLVLAPASEASVQDRRGRFREIYCVHWAVAVPINRTHATIASMFVTQNAYPREALLEALLRFVEEDLTTQPR